MMLQILQLFLLCTILPPSNVSTGKGEILEIKITRQTTLEELKQVQQKLKQEGIQLEIKESQYLTPNHLKAIRIRVDFGDGKPQTYGARNFNRFWIVKDGREGAEQPFYIGGKRLEL